MNKERTNKPEWPASELKKIVSADDFHIAPLRDDGITYGTPTWIWSVFVNNALYVRAYNGKNSSWYLAAMKQKEGLITSAGITREVTFEPVEGPVNDLIDEAYRIKYNKNPYFDPMIGKRARSATVKVVPRII